ncbi:MAG: VCBS repeat-containing protein [Candidatus Sabulitectum sp.]|nr:VCBS repeat-containing protein [Candidatus Sabulitectum sp.]
MKIKTSNLLITLTVLFAFVKVGLCNDPDPNTPWPIGFSTGEMSNSRTIMNSFGDPNGDWAFGTFHGAIDIDATTGDPDCNQVRCVDDGWVTRRELLSVPGMPGITGWNVIICDEEGGVVENGWSYGHLDVPVVAEGTYVEEGELIGEMIVHPSHPEYTPHLHFLWSEWNNNVFAKGNPLQFLDALPVSGEGYEWEFNPLSHPDPFESFFLPYMWYQNWDNLSVGGTFDAMLDPSYLSGNVDFFFGMSLRGDGMPGGQGVGRNSLAPQKVKWDVVQILSGDENIIDTKWVFDFDCWLSNLPDARDQMLYFRHFMGDMYAKNGLLMCLSNCIDSDGWDGINNIADACWDTDSDYEGTASTINPILAKYPDGSYRLDVICYSFDETYTFPKSVDGVELHNFSPALCEVSINDPVTDVNYYHAEWIPNGLSAELDISVDEEVTEGTDLEVTLIFTESMMTNSISASLGPLPITNGTWSSSVVTNDTWTGEVTMPTDVGKGEFILSVSATDTDLNSLMNPEGVGSVPVSPTPDTHHSLDVSFGCQLDWVTSIHSYILGSPKLADMDDDGDLDIILQSEDGYVDVLNDDGSSMWGGAVDGGWQALPWDPPTVSASPAIANLSEDVSPEIIAVNPNGCNGFQSTGNVILNWEGIMLAESPDPAIIYALRWYSSSSPVCFNGEGNSYHEHVNGRNRIYEGTGIGIFSARGTDGSPFWGTDIGSNSTESVSATPCIADVDNDGELEVVVATSHKQTATNGGVDEDCWVYCLDAESGEQEWAYNAGVEHIYSNVVAGDLDGDDYLEIVIGTLAVPGAVRVIDGYTGTVESWGNLSTGSMILSGASIADIDSDGDNDIAISCVDNKVYCWEGGTGSDLDGFPLDLGTRTNSGISIGDVDSNGMLELVIAGRDGKLWVINHDGTITAGFPVTVSGNILSGQPAIGDIDNDGRLEIIFGEYNNSVIHCYEMGENSAYNDLPWPQFQHDEKNTGCYINLPPAPPTGFIGSGVLSGSIFTVELDWILSVNDPDYTPYPTPPADVINYRIYRKIPPRPLELAGTVPAGTTEFTDLVDVSNFVPVVAYTVCAWDGENESVYTDWVKLLPYEMDIVSRGCPVREITRSATVGTTSTSITGAGSSALTGREHLNSCRILTDGEYEAVYSPSSSSNCVEIDLGGMFTISDVIVIGTDLSLCETPLYELSSNGRDFSRIDSGHARYVRVYGVAGATEIEVLGCYDEETSALVEVRRSNSEGYRIVAAEEGSPITATVFDLSGRSVWRGSSSTGEILWNRSNSSGNTVPSGIYLIMVESDDMETFTAKVVVR